MSDVTQLPVPNEQEVSELVEAICVTFLDKIKDNNLVIAALADCLGLSCEMDKEHCDALLDYACERAWNYAHTVFVKRATPKPDNVTPLMTPRKPDADDEPKE